MTDETTLNFHHFKIKCLACSLHYTVCSDHESWHTREATYCPECGSVGPKLCWHELATGFIFDHVPGTSDRLGIIGQNQDESSDGGTSGG